MRRIQDWFRAHPLLADAMLAALCLLLALPSAEVIEGYREFDSLGAGLVVLETLPIVARRRAPFAVLALTGTAFSLLNALGYAPSGGALGPGLAIYTVASGSSERALVTGAVATAFVAALASPLLYDGQIQEDQFWGPVVVMGGAWLIGTRIQRTRTSLASLEQRADRAERQREEDTRRAVADERARIARELHDVIAHTIGVVVVQAAAARRTLRREPDRTADSLEAIEGAGRDSLGEMRRLLAVLRAADGAADREPTPGIGQLDALAERVREAGLPVELSTAGEPRPLPAGIELATYRVVQEALTNALKHAGPAGARVALHFREDAVEVRITDDGEGSAPQQAPPEQIGHGLIGMRERVALYGGTLKAGPRPGGGFEVWARIPLDGGQG